MIFHSIKITILRRILNSYGYFIVDQKRFENNWSLYKKIRGKNSDYKDRWISLIVEIWIYKSWMYKFINKPWLFILF